MIEIIKKHSFFDRECFVVKIPYSRIIGDIVLEKNSFILGLSTNRFQQKDIHLITHTIDESTLGKVVACAENSVGWVVDIDDDYVYARIPDFLFFEKLVDLNYSCIPTAITYPIKNNTYSVIKICHFLLVKEKETMRFNKAYEALKNGSKIARKHWLGYWVKEDNTIKMYCKDGEVLDIRDTKDTFYTFDNMMADDWVILDSDTPVKIIKTFRFGEAIRYIKAGKRVMRKSWKDTCIAYQKGYPDGISCNKQTAEAWGIEEGSKFICNPYLQLQRKDGDSYIHDMYNPSNEDILAEDWCLAD